MKKTCDLKIIFNVPANIYIFESMCSTCSIWQGRWELWLWTIIVHFDFHFNTDTLAAQIPEPATWVLDRPTQYQCNSVELKYRVPIHVAQDDEECFLHLENNHVTVFEGIVNIRAQMCCNSTCVKLTQNMAGKVYILLLYYFVVFYKKKKSDKVIIQTVK